MPNPEGKNGYGEKVGVFILHIEGIFDLPHIWVDQLLMRRFYGKPSFNMLERGSHYLSV